VATDIAAKLNEGTQLEFQVDTNDIALVLSANNQTVQVTIEVGTNETAWTIRDEVYQWKTFETSGAHGVIEGEIRVQCPFVPPPPSAPPPDGKDADATAMSIIFLVFLLIIGGGLLSALCGGKSSDKARPVSTVETVQT
jgi:hypothetical protein